MRRFEQRWTRWDQAVAAGERPSDFLPKLPDEVLIQLLGGISRDGRLYEWNLITTELLNRLARLREALGDVAQAADHHIGAAIEEAEQAQEAIQRTVDAVETHVKVRADQISNEPETAQSAHDATVRVRERLEEADAVRARLAHIAAEVQGQSDPEA